MFRNFSNEIPYSVPHFRKLCPVMKFRRVSLGAPWMFRGGRGRGRSGDWQRSLEDANACLALLPEHAKCRGEDVGRCWIKHTKEMCLIDSTLEFVIDNYRYIS